MVPFLMLPWKVLKVTLYWLLVGERDTRARVKKLGKEVLHPY